MSDSTNVATTQTPVPGQLRLVPSLQVTLIGPDYAKVRATSEFQQFDGSSWRRKKADDLWISLAVGGSTVDSDSERKASRLDVEYDFFYEPGRRPQVLCLHRANNGAFQVITADPPPFVIGA